MNVVLRLLAHLTAIAGLGLWVVCCVGDEIIVRNEGFNAKLRPDREPLDYPQLAINIGELRFGPYRPLVSDLANPLIPVDINIANLPQSDCWWMGRSANFGADNVRAHWEAVVVVTGDEFVIENYVDPSDGVLDLGLCRVSDPDTREPLRHRDADPALVQRSFDCSSSGDFLSFTVGDGNNLPRCTADTSLFLVRLEAYGMPQQDPLNRCPTVDRFSVRERLIEHEVDGFDGPDNDLPGDEILVSACTNAFGNSLMPPVPTRYRLRLDEHVVQDLDPMLMPAVAGQRLRRATQAAGPTIPAGTPYRWATSVEASPSGAVRWNENFSRSLRVGEVRVFRVGAAENPIEIGTEPAPALCIEDPDHGTGCRWSCADSAAGDGRLHYNLLAADTCRLGSPTGSPEVPLLTPTYALSTAETVVVHAPLGWSAVVPGAGAPAIEFTLATTFMPAMLIAEPAAIDLGGMRVGERERGAFLVRNAGSHPIRITSLQMFGPNGESPHPGDFTPELPFAPVPLPLPVEIVALDSKSQSVRMTGDAESQTFATLFEDFAHLRFAPRGGGFSATRDGTTVNERYGLLLRDRVDAHFTFKPDTLGAQMPAARVTYALRTPPFVVQPGGSFEVSVIARPAALGRRVARVRILGESVLDPSQRVDIREAVFTTGMLGALLTGTPRHVSISVDGDSVATTRAVLLQNEGDSNATFGAPTLTRRGGGALPAGSPLGLDDPYRGGGTLAPGESRIVRVEFRSDCRGATGGSCRDDIADLRWSTADGPLVVPVQATTHCPP